MKYDKTNLASLFLSTLIPLISSSVHASESIIYNPIINRLKIENYCKSNFAYATLGIKAINDNKEQEVADTISANSKGCISLSIDNIKCEKIRIYATAPPSVSGQHYEETCSATVNLEKVRNEAKNKAANLKSNHH